MNRCSTRAFPYRIRSGDTLWLLANRFSTTVEAIMSLNPMLNADNLQIGQVIYIPQNRGTQPMPPQPPSDCITKAQMKLSNHMRMLWEQHVYWTRLVINSMAFGLPDVKFVTNRLLRNPKDFEAALKPLYGADIAAKFSALFTSHLTIAAELVTAAKAGDAAAVADAEKRWYANADQIAAFLSSINPYWSEQEWKKMLYSHLAMTKTEAVEILSQKFQDSINTFDKIEQEALMMADMMTQGLVKQFPQQFR